MDIAFFANMVSAAAAFTAAGLWWKSTVVEVLQDDTPDENGIIGASLVVEGKTGMVDVVSTQHAATAISRNAAIAAAVAALAQGVAASVHVLTTFI